MMEYRKLTHEDYDDILDISKGIWDGYDYLPSVFHEWVDADGFFLGAVDVGNNKIVGTGKYSILYDGSGWLEGLRVHKDYRSQKIARGISEYLLKIAMEELAKGNINKIGFGTHVTNIESITLMKKLNFKLEKELIIVSRESYKHDSSLSINDFEVKSWDISYEDFKNLPYFKRRDNILPIAFMFQEPTEELYNEFKAHNGLLNINGFNGMIKIKGDPYFEVVDESFEAVDTFMNYMLVTLEDRNLPTPITSLLPDNHEVIEKLKAAGFEAWNEWKPDYLYYVYRG